MTARLAIIGVGSWGSKILTTLCESTTLSLAAVVTSKSRSELQAIAPFDGNIFREYEQLNSLHGDLDGVIIATPPEGRERIIDFFLNSSVPVFSEKPMTLDARQTARLVEKARHRSLKLVEDFIHLYSWPYITIYQSVFPSNHMEIKSTGGNSGPYRNYSPVYDYGPHDLSMVLQSFKSKPQAIAVEVFDWKSEFKFSCMVELDFGERGTALLTFGNTFDHKQRIFSCRTDENEWIYDDTATEKLSVNGSSQKPDEFLSNHSPLQLALECFAGKHSFYSNEESYWLSESVASLSDEIVRLVKKRKYPRL